MESIRTTSAERAMIEHDVAVLEAWIDGGEAAPSAEPSDVDLCDALAALEHIRRVRAQLAAQR
jgi:hypothetical protein